MGTGEGSKGGSEGGSERAIDGGRCKGGSEGSAVVGTGEGDIIGQADGTTDGRLGAVEGSASQLPTRRRIKAMTTSIIAASASEKEMRGRQCPKPNQILQKKLERKQ